MDDLHGGPFGLQRPVKDIFYCSILLFRECRKYPLQPDLLKLQEKRGAMPARAG
jgi:hypothetical protein